MWFVTKYTLYTIFNTVVSIIQWCRIGTGSWPCPRFMKTFHGACAPRAPVWPPSINCARQMRNCVNCMSHTTKLSLIWIYFGWIVNGKMTREKHQTHLSWYKVSLPETTSKYIRYPPSIHTVALFYRGRTEMLEILPECISLCFLSSMME